MSTTTLSAMNRDLAERTPDPSVLALSLDFCRMVRCLYDTNGAPITALQQFIDRYPRSFSIERVRNAAMTAATTTDSDWASPLVGLRPLVDAFLEFVRPLTILGRISGLRRVPFQVQVAAQIAGGTYRWVSQGVAKPVGQLAYDGVSLQREKASGILVVSAELLKAPGAGAEVLLRAELAAGLGAFVDSTLIDPDSPGSPATSPASILSGATAIPSSGVALDDLRTLIATFVASFPNTSGLVLLLSPANAVTIAASGNFPDLRINGGSIFGIPVVTSAAMADRVALLDAPSLLLADDGELDISLSRHASIQMNSAPDNPATASTVPTSFWQNNLVGFRVERVINWQLGRANAVQYIDNAAYIGGSPAL
jgi:hypothetical protein